MQALKRSTELAVTGVKSALHSRTYRHLPVKKNPYIEAWYNAREDMEYTSVITQGMLVTGFIWALAIPFVVYEGIITEFKTCERVLGSKHLKMYPEPVGYEPRSY